MKKKKPTLKARGIRFSDKAWNNLEKDAKKEKSTPSDLVRNIVDKHYDKK